MEGNGEREMLNEENKYDKDRSECFSTRGIGKEEKSRNWEEAAGTSRWTKI